MFLCSHNYQALDALDMMQLILAILKAKVNNVIHDEGMTFSDCIYYVFLFSIWRHQFAEIFLYYGRKMMQQFNSVNGVSIFQRRRSIAL